MNLPSVKQSQSFWTIIFSQKYIGLEEADNMEPHEGEMRGHHMAKTSSHVVGPCFYLVGPFTSFL
jgi:hypothetical protein